MLRVILIAGNALRFYEDVRDLKGYLLRTVGFEPAAVRVLQTAYGCEETHAAHISHALEQVTVEPLLLAYCGHGGLAGWGYDDARTYGYDGLAAQLKEARRPVMFMNDCCHAMAMVPFLLKHGVRPHRVSLLAASEADKVTTGGLVNIVIENWGRRRAVRFGPKLRWGKRLDQHFFAPFTDLAR